MENDRTGMLPGSSNAWPFATGIVGSPQGPSLVAFPESREYIRGLAQSYLFHQSDKGITASPRGISMLLRLERHDNAAGMCEGL